MNNYANPLNKYEEKYGELFHTQIEIEDYFTDLARESLKNSIQHSEEEYNTSAQKTGQALTSLAFDEAKEAVKTWMDKLLKPKGGVKPSYLQTVKDMVDVYTTPEKVCRMDDLLNVLTLVPLVNLLDHLGHEEHIILNNSANMVSKAIQDEVKIEAFLKTIPENIQKGLFSGIRTRGNRHYKVAYARQCMVKQGFSMEPWDKTIGIQLCSILLELIINSSGFFDIHHSTNVKGVKDEQAIAIPTPWLLKTWEENNDKLMQKTHRNCPMVIPPIPWSTLNDGGYYGEQCGRHSLLRADALNSGGGSLNVYSKKYLRKFEETDISRVRESINIIQNVPWKINRTVYNALRDIILRGGEMAGVPRMEPYEQEKDLPEGYTEEELKAHKKKKWEIYCKDVTRKSISLRALSHFKTATKFLDFDNIYFPYNTDFRGRVYPISSFSPQSDDINKGLLVFSNAPPVTCEDDVKWLSIHGANVAGNDKCSFEDRIQWVQDHEEQILRSAEDPMGYHWWMQQDETSFQLLAFCVEYANLKEYQKNHAGSSIGFVCSIPIAFDGTCSGLQHYSAILRDPIGGSAVNLIPSEKPNDIYRVVAEKVAEKVAHDCRYGTADEEVTKEYKVKAHNGVPEHMEEKTRMVTGTKSLALQWSTHGVNRSVTKSCVMTLAYGAGQFGFKDQIMKNVIDKNPEKFLDKTGCALYMAKLIWDTVQDVVVKAMEGMKYLKKLSALVCKEGQIISWTTPLGLPIQQAYMEESNERVQLRLGGSVRRWAYITKTTGNIDKKRQVGAIAPNFIHSLDACHLQLTVLNAHKVGVNHFALIHDSFGCPLSQASTMFKVIRESFLELYTKHDVLAEFTQQLEGYIEDDVDMPTIPDKGTLDLTSVLESTYMFA